MSAKITVNKRTLLYFLILLYELNNQVITSLIPHDRTRIAISTHFCPKPIFISTEQALLIGLKTSGTRAALPLVGFVNSNISVMFIMQIQTRQPQQNPLCSAICKIDNYLHARVYRLTPCIYSGVAKMQSNKLFSCLCCPLLTVVFWYHLHFYVCDLDFWS